MLLLERVTTGLVQTTGAIAFYIVIDGQKIGHVLTFKDKCAVDGELQYCEMMLPHPYQNDKKLIAEIALKFQQIFNSIIENEKL